MTGPLYIHRDNLCIQHQTAACTIDKVFGPQHCAWPLAAQQARHPPHLDNNCLYASASSQYAFAQHRSHSQWLGVMTLWPVSLPTTHAWLTIAYYMIAGQGGGFLATSQTARNNQVPSNFERRQKHRGQTRVWNGMEIVSRYTQCGEGECTTAMMPCGAASDASVQAPV